MRAALLAAFLLLPLAVAPAAGEPGPTERTLLVDPQGDAQEAGAAMLMDTVCASLCPPPEELDPASVPAPPSLDVIAIHARSDPEDLVLVMELASLDEARTGWISEERGTSFRICWDRVEVGCPESVRFFAKPSPGGKMLTGANFAYRHEGCNGISLCGWGIATQIVPGTPGRIEMFVPRGLAPSPIEAGDAISNFQVLVSRDVRAPAGVATDDLPPDLFTEQTTSVDVASGGEAYVLESARAAAPAPSRAPWGLGPGVVFGQVHGESEADLLEVTYAETPTTFTLVHKLAVVSDPPSDQTLRTEWGLQGGSYHIVRVKALQGQRTIESIACDPTPGASCANSVDVPAVFEVAAGSPGFVNVTYLRADIGAPAAGVQSTRALTVVDYGPGGGSGVVTDHDQSGLLPPYVLRLATRDVPPPEGAVRIDDAPSDARIPAVADAPDATTLEVTHAEAQALPGSYVRLALGLRDAGPAAVPAGYAGALRAIAVEEGGRRTMAAVYRDGSGERAFCAADTAVLASPRTMPPEGSWRELSTTSSPEGAPGNITFFVPPECLAPLAPGATRRAERLAAASFLVRDSPGAPPELVVVDEVLGIEPFDLVLVASAGAPILAPVPAEAGVSLWIWLLLAGAVVLAGGGVAAALLLRRREAKPLLPAPGVLFLGKYLVDRELGRGGFGAVWLATHARLDRKVVIKQLQPGWASDPRAAERFRREARVLAKLDHPNITRVYDAEEVAGLAFIVMEYVEGGTVGDLRPLPASIATVGRLGAELLDALAAIHAAGIVHGDLKPDNVLIAADRTVRVADFGIARPMDTLTPTAMRTMGYGSDGPVGTPLFMAPEQLEGGAASPASDLYATAAVVHHVATGRLLFSPAPVDVVSARLAHERGAPDAGEGLLHPALVAWLRRGLARDPRDRFATAVEMREALLAAVAVARSQASSGS